MHIKKLIIGDMHPDIIDFETWGIVSITNSLLKLDLLKIKSRKEADEYLKPFINNDLMRSFLLSNLKEVGNNKFEWKMDLKSIADNLKNISEFKEYNTTFMNPTLFLKGEKSNGISKEKHFLKINNFFPNNKIYVFKDTGNSLL
jgi:esterase